jgi:hypothetical protein
MAPRPRKAMVMTVPFEAKAVLDQQLRRSVCRAPCLSRLARRAPDFQRAIEGDDAD